MVLRVQPAYGGNNGKDESLPETTQSGPITTGPVAVRTAHFVDRKSQRSVTVGVPATPGGARQWYDDKSPSLLSNAMRTILLRFCLLVSYIVLVAVRMPQVLLKGRFWAEEGAIYFINARTQPWPEALFTIHTGYLNLAASVAGLLAAHAVPLDEAPWASTIFALLIQLCPPFLLLTSAIPWLRHRWAMAVALLLLLTASASGEVWLNSITSQFHLGLCSALILAMPARGGAAGIFRCALLFLAPLSGPASAFLAPLFILRGCFDRSWRRIAQGVLVGGTSGIQLAMVIMHAEPARIYGIGPRLFALVIYQRHILIPFFGIAHSDTLTLHLAVDFLTGRPLWGPTLVSTGWVAAMFLMVWRSRNTEARWFLIAGMVVMTMTYFAALGRHVELLDAAFGDRYSYIPSALFGLALFGVARTSAGWLRGVSTVWVAWLILIGTYGYFQPRSPFREGPSWHAQVAKWRTDPYYRVQFWPDNSYWLWYMLPSLSCISHPEDCADGHE
jgi:hypothetical protein